jgi:hypothetical protein
MTDSAQRLRTQLADFATASPRSGAGWQRGYKTKLRPVQAIAVEKAGLDASWLIRCASLTLAASTLR